MTEVSIAPEGKTPRARAPRRKAVSKPAAETEPTSIANLSDAVGVPSMVDAREIEECAYQSWIERGCPMGSPEEDWYRAEREVIARFASATK